MTFYDFGIILPHELATWISKEHKKLYCFNRSHLETGTNLQLIVSLVSKPKNKLQSNLRSVGPTVSKQPQKINLKLTPLGKRRTHPIIDSKLWSERNHETWMVNLLSVEIPFWNPA